MLTDEELAKLTGFDMHWIPGYLGDSYATLNETPLTLSNPRDPTLTYTDGKVTTTHIRDFATPVQLGKAVLKLQTYDPTLYVDYEMSPDVALVGASPSQRCQVIFRPADTAKAKKELEAAVKAMSQDAESDFPRMGKRFASEAWVICASN